MTAVLSLVWFALLATIAMSLAAIALTVVFERRDRRDARALAQLRAHQDLQRAARESRRPLCVVGDNVVAFPARRSGSDAA